MPCLIIMSDICHPFDSCKRIDKNKASWFKEQELLELILFTKITFVLFMDDKFVYHYQNLDRETIKNR